MTSGLASRGVSRSDWDRAMDGARLRFTMQKRGQKYPVVESVSHLNEPPARAGERHRLSPGWSCESIAIGPEELDFVDRGRE